MSETKDKAELLVIANLAEQAERYDGKYGLSFISLEYLPTQYSQGIRTKFGKSSDFLLPNQKVARALTSNSEQIREPACVSN